MGYSLCGQDGNTTSNRTGVTPDRTGLPPDRTGFPLVKTGGTSLWSGQDCHPRQDRSTTPRQGRDTFPRVLDMGHPQTGQVAPGTRVLPPPRGQDRDTTSNRTGVTPDRTGSPPDKTGFPLVKTRGTSCGQERVLPLNRTGIHPPPLGFWISVTPDWLRLGWYASCGQAG